jgi:hypothetical protein
MDTPRKPLAKIEGRKRMQVSGLTVAWHGTRHMTDWVAYVENGSEQGRLLLADQVSERTVKSLLARIQNLSRDDLEAMGRPAEAVAAQGGGPPVRRPRGGDGEAPQSAGVIVQSASGRHLALSTDAGREAPAVTTPRQRRLPTAIAGAPPAETRRPARTSARELAGTVRQLRSRVEGLEAEQEQLRAEIALLRGDSPADDGPPSIFVTGWFRATLMLIVLAIVLVVTVPWVMEFIEGGSQEPRPAARTESPAPSSLPLPANR